MKKVRFCYRNLCYFMILFENLSILMISGWNNTISDELDRNLEQEKMGPSFYNENPNIVVDYMDSYFRQKETDCSLYSEDGIEYPIHKVSTYLLELRSAMSYTYILPSTVSTLFYLDYIFVLQELLCQTKFLCAIANSTNVENCSKLEIFIPSLSSFDLQHIIKFLYR